jgi:hypothetical protein
LTAVDGDQGCSWRFRRAGPAAIQPVSQRDSASPRCVHFAGKPDFLTELLNDLRMALQSRARLSQMVRLLLSLLRQRPPHGFDLHSDLVEL